ncbi:hypothetical protein AAAT57_11595 [Bifidobacterium longum]|uniref:hypothetical protein n=1 Tax=Bifidobacterium longum TaxID=216816 RepID=UPI0032C124FD
MSAELSSLGIAQIVESVIADYDLRDENGNELTDDLYVIRSERLDELGLTVARRIHKAIRELETQGKTGFPVHSMLCGHTPPTITTADDGDLHAALRQRQRSGCSQRPQQDRIGRRQENHQRLSQGGENP